MSSSGIFYCDLFFGGMDVVSACYCQYPMYCAHHLEPGAGVYGENQQMEGVRFAGSGAIGGIATALNVLNNIQGGGFT